METLFELRIRQLVALKTPDLFGQTKRGIERECLRVSPSGQLSLKAHPERLGSSLTHPYITTDFVESQLEFITKPLPSYQAVQQALQDLHVFAYQHIGDELLWSNSMPCKIGEEPDIPIARYGSSNTGMMKCIYRRGLAHRYGRYMQTISGIHYNFSLGESFWPKYQQIERQQQTNKSLNVPLGQFISSHYMQLIRNFLRVDWLIPYLFGATPVVCKSFIKNNNTHLQSLDKHSYYLPYATSLRMSDIGYQNLTQSDLNISYNSLGQYIESLSRAISTSEPLFTKIPVKANGEYQQLNDHILQIENEHYTNIRPKRPIHAGERPTLALKRRGIEYIEVRSVDINPFEPLGINIKQMQFIDLLLIYCLLDESSLLDLSHWQEIQQNQKRTVTEGRKPGLKLLRNGQAIALADWANEIFDKLEVIAELLDQEKNTLANGEQSFSALLQSQRQVLDQPESSLSGRVMEDIRINKASFFEITMEKSRQHRQFLNNVKLSAEKLDYYTEVAEKSLHDQQQQQESQGISFEQHLKNYFD